MLYQLAELLLPYPDPVQHPATASALDAPNEFLVEAPDLDTIAEWLQFLGEDTTVEQLRARFQRQDGLVCLP